ncbi:GLPGLI family protein [Rufibacter quisquiliarum]|uniref:GLPGLI family protein n=1 Tax=Rufibacter quisquiliarum TaxID=1549639 RepID=A0A839GJM7_9BACT|nr:GLPGLI family protein [Rufibacter quisquiliarum]MBA9077943.1 GLPGLI family protein [Rufibacter quisquiliarum]
MKSILTTLFFFILLCASTGAMAQEGVIIYEVKVNLHRALTKERESMKAMMPEFNVSKQALYFNQQASLYKRMVDEEEEAAAGTSGTSFRIRMGGGELFLVPSESKRISLREFNGKKYLIQDSLSTLPWKFGKETKTIAGYVCRQATYFQEQRNQTVVAWYTEKLRPYLGPDSYASLPGAVLELDVNNGERVVKALQVDVRPLKKGELVEPVKGEKVTEKQYQAMLSEQMERMRQGGGNIMIRN